MDQIFTKASGVASLNVKKKTIYFTAIKPYTQLLVNGCCPSIEKGRMSELARKFVYMSEVTHIHIFSVLLQTVW